MNMRPIKPDEIPTTEHWVLIEGDSVYIEGDERSRTAPGHSYPAHTVNYLTYIAFPSLQSLQEEVTRREKAKYTSSKSYRVLHVQPLNIETTVMVKVTDAMLAAREKGGQ